MGVIKGMLGVEAIAYINALCIPTARFTRESWKIQWKYGYGGCDSRPHKVYKGCRNYCATSEGSGSPSPSKKPVTVI